MAKQNQITCIDIIYLSCDNCVHNCGGYVIRKYSCGICILNCSSNIIGNYSWNNSILN